MRLFEELVDFEKEIQRIVDDMITALMAENIRAVNLNSFVNTIYDMFPGKTISKEEIKNKIRNYLLSHSKTSKIVNDMVYLEGDTLAPLTSSPPEDEVEKMAKKHALQKLIKK